MKTNSNNNSNETRNAANMAASNNQQNAAQKIDDFGQKIGGARKDLYAAAREWAEKLADITADQLAAVGVSKLVRLPNLESMTAAGAITAQQARAALVVWRSIEAKPAKAGRLSGWAERTREKLDIIAAILTADNAADIAETLSEAPEFRILTAANWPAEAFTFGRYTVSEYRSSYDPAAARYFRIYSGRYSVGEKSGEAANIAAQLREMTARDAEKQAESRARGPKLGVYHTSDLTRYFIAVENKCEIVLKVCDTYQEAAEAVKNERAELLARYEDLKTFPALRRSWNRPRVGKVWHAEDVTPEQFAAVLPFKGVEFGNWLNQQERAALLNSAFDGFHDLADLLGIPAEAVALGGRLNFSFATRGHAGSAAHFETAYNTINLNKRNGAGCMAHEWLHACDHYAAVLAGRGAACSWGSAFATEYTGEPTTDADRAAAELVAVIRSMNYYTRSQNYQAITGKNQGGADYYTQPCELAARGFEGVMLYLLTKAGACSDFLVNLEDWKTFEINDKGHRRDCYPYPSDAEAAALLPYYIKFFRALFGRCEVSKEAAEGVAAATLQAEQEKQEADRAAAEKAEQERKESEARREAQRQEWARKAAERQAEQERQAAEVKAKAEATRAAIVERLTAAHFDSIATDCDAAAVYFAAHLYGEIYTGKAEIKSEPAEIAATVQAAPLACLQYKYIHNAKRVICHRWQVASVRSNKRTARELLASLQPSEVRAICRAFVDFESADNWQKAAELWADTERLHEEQARRHQEAAERAAVSEPTESKPAEGEAVSVAGNSPEGLQLVTIPGGVAVVGTADTEKARGRQTYRARREIKAHGAQWNHAANQWQATDPDSVARLREWFGVSETPAETVSESESEGTAPAVAPVLETLQDITDSQNDAPAVVLPEWLKVGARVRTRGGYMISARTMRREWVEGHEMTVKEINAERVELEERDARGLIIANQGIALECAAAELSPVCYSESAKLEDEPAAIAASEDEGAPVAESEQEQNRDGLPEWLHVGTRFVLIDFATGEPTKSVYTCAAIDYENKTVTIPEAADVFRGGSHVYRWDGIHWPQFAPLQDPAEIEETPARVVTAAEAIREQLEEMGMKPAQGDRPAVGPDTLQEAGDITAPALPEWVKDGARCQLMHKGQKLTGYISNLHLGWKGRHWVCNFHESGTLFETTCNPAELIQIEEPAAVAASYETAAPSYTKSEKSEPTRNQVIAKIIVQQLGGGQFAMMTGAKNFAAIDNGVRFHIGKNKTRANVVKIILRGDDTYNMEFWHIGQEVNPYTILMRYADKGLSPEEFNKQVKEATERAQKAAEPVKLKAYEGIYCDQLQELFTEYTELYTRLF